MQNVKDRIQIQVYIIINESVNHSSLFIPVKVKKNLRKSQVQFREKLRKLRLRQNNDCRIKKRVCYALIRSSDIFRDCISSNILPMSKNSAARFKR